MSFVGIFLSALLGTAVLGAVAKAVIDLFSVSRPARFGGFCVALGFALGRYAYSGPVDGRLVDIVSAATGAVIALAGLWYWLIKRGHTADGTERP